MIRDGVFFFKEVDFLSFFTFFFLYSLTWYGYHETIENEDYLSFYCLIIQMVQIWFVDKEEKKKFLRWKDVIYNLGSLYLNKIVICYLESFRAARHGSKNVVSIHCSQNQWRTVPFLSTESTQLMKKKKTNGKLLFGVVFCVCRKYLPASDYTILRTSVQATHTNCS